MNRSRSKSRVLAGFAAVLGAWLFADSLASSGLVSGTRSDPEFFFFWGMPFGVAGILLGGYAIRGARDGVARVTRLGSVGGLLAGGVVALAFLASPLLMPWDALHGAVAAVRYTPVAAVTGSLIGIVAGSMQERRPGGRRSR